MASQSEELSLINRPSQEVHRQLSYEIRTKLACRRDCLCQSNPNWLDISESVTI